MLLSHQHKFIYIKTGKTAGTSTEMLLSSFLTHPDDIITPISQEDEEVRASYGIFPRNHKNGQFWNHMSAADIKAAISPDIWNNYLKITSERHPYEKAVSQAYFNQRPGSEVSIPDMSFEDYLEKTVQAGTYRCFQFYTLAGKVVADIIIQHEHLQEHLQKLFDRLSLQPVIPLPTAKSRFRQDKRPAVEILTDAQKKVIQKKCAEEFEFFNYAT